MVIVQNPIIIMMYVGCESIHSHRCKINEYGSNENRTKRECEEVWRRKIEARRIEAKNIELRRIVVIGIEARKIRARTIVTKRIEGKQD